MSLGNDNFRKLMNFSRKTFQQLVKGNKEFLNLFLCNMLYCTILYYIVLSTILNYIVLYYTRLYYIVLYCTIPYYTACHILVKMIQINHNSQCLFTVYLNTIQIFEGGLIGKLVIV